MAVFTDSGLLWGQHRCDVQTRRGTRCKRKARGRIIASLYRPESVGRYQCLQHRSFRTDALRWW